MLAVRAALGYSAKAGLREGLVSLMTVLGKARRETREGKDSDRTTSCTYLNC